MVEADQLLNGEWLEYSGGSRPHTNRIRFCATTDGFVLIQLWYIFDHLTGGNQLVTFTIEQAEFDLLFQELVKHGHATLNKSDEYQQLRFEWMTTRDGFAFRLKGRALIPFEPELGLEFSDFRSVNLREINQAINGFA
jgi:hypothetical protein